VFAYLLARGADPAASPGAEVGKSGQELGE